MTPEYQQQGFYYPGMSLRDYLAAKAEGPDKDCSAATVAHQLGWDRPEYSINDYRAWFLWWRRAVSAWKYAEADAMLAAREAK
jgi:hypothetical protein